MKRSKMEIPMIDSPAYEELIDFIAAGTTPQSVVAFHPSETAKE